MKLKEAIETLGGIKSIEIVKGLSQESDVKLRAGLLCVFNAIVSDADRIPNNIGGKNDNEEHAINKWVLKFKQGHEGRASQRKSNPPGTIADPIIQKIISARLTGLSSVELSKITCAHRLSMSAENILGLILEEYLADSLEEVGWYCAWGETIKSVDFVHQDGRLLQIKNRSNSENSSSSSVRKGTEIIKWYRIQANKVEYMWGSLNEICGTSRLSEEGFSDFVRATISNNPSCLAVEENKFWV